MVNYRKRLLTIKHPKELEIKNQLQQRKRTSSIRNIRFIANKDKFKLALSEYLSLSSVHGLKILPDWSRPKLERFIWLLGVLTVLSFNIWMMYYIYADFLEAPTATTLLPTRKPVTIIPFPALAICNGNRLSRAKITNLANNLFALQNTSKIQLTKNSTEMFDFVLLIGTFFNFNLDDIDYYKLERFHNFLNDVYNGSYSPGDLANQLYLPCEDFIKDCRLHGTSAKCKKIFQMRKTHVGRCCTFNYQRLSESNLWKLWKTKSALPPANPFYLRGPGIDMGLSVIIDNNMDDYSFALNSNVATYIYVYDPMDFPDEVSGATIEQMVNPGQEVFLSLHPQPVIGLDTMRDVPLESRKCLFRNEEKLSYDYFYSFAECNLACRLEDLISFCQCIPFFMQFMYNTSECQLNDILCLQKWNDKWSNVEIAMGDRKRDGLSFHCPECMPSCNYIKYKVQASYGYIRGKLSNVTRSKYIAPTDSVLHVYFGESYVNDYQQTIVHTWYEMLSMFGGIISITMGASMISGVEILYFASGKYTMLFWEKIFHPDIPLEDKVSGKSLSGRLHLFDNSILTRSDGEPKNLATLYWGEMKSKGLNNQKLQITRS